MPAITFARFADELDQLYAPPLRRPSTYRQVRQVLRELAVVPVRKTSDFKPTTIAAWLRLHPERTPVTWASHLRCFRAICQCAVSCGYIRQSPFDFRGVSQWVRVDVPRADRLRRQRHLTDGQIRVLLNQADAEAGEGSWQAGRIQALVWLLAFTGLRAGEALHLGCADVDLSRRVVMIQPQETWRPKTAGSARPVPLENEDLLERLGRWGQRCGGVHFLPGIKLRGPWVNGGPGVRALDHVRDLGLRCEPKVEGATLLGFRKTIATYAKLWGISRESRMKLLGHTNIHTAEEWYDEDELEIMRSIVGRIRYG